MEQRDVMLRKMPKDLHMKAKLEAVRLEMPLNRFIEMVLEEYFRAKEEASHDDTK